MYDYREAGCARLETCGLTLTVSLVMGAESRGKRLYHSFTPGVHVTNRSIGHESMSQDCSKRYLNKHPRGLHKEPASASYNPNRIYGTFPGVGGEFHSLFISISTRHRAAVMTVRRRTPGR